MARALTQRQRQRPRQGRWWWVSLATVMVVLYVPIAVVVLLSFNTSKYGTLPFHFTTHWYRVLVTDGDLLTAAWHSLVFSALVAAAALVCGTAAALWLTRDARRAAIPLTGLMTAAISIPWLILAISILLVANMLGVGRGFVALFVGSLAVVMPYVTFLVSARLQGMGTRLEEAAASLGASSWTAFRLVTLPQLARPAGSGTLFAFVITFNNFPVQYFLAPFGFHTLPLEIYTMVRTGYEPNINALATLLVLAAILIAIVVSRQGEGKGIALQI